MNLVDFIHKWTASTRTERAASQEHFIDLCRVLGEPTPNEADPHGDFYAFEKGTGKVGGGEGFADVWLKDHFGWEYKGKRKSLKDAYEQLLQYHESLESPPLLVVCDLDRFEVHTKFTGTAKRVYAFALADLPNPEPTPTCPLPPLDVLRRLFKNPGSLRPEQTTAQVTERAAAEFATLAQRLHSRGESAETTAHFLMRLLFCLFAEDIGLLPQQLFARLVERTRRQPEDFQALLAQLFAAMATGGWFGSDRILHFNGGLFANNTVLPLTTEDLDSLQRASALDWSSVEPAIFGTLFERSLDPAKRAQLGAHYTSREDIELIVEPVLMAPLRRRWAAVQELAQPFVAALRDATRGNRESRERPLRQLLLAFDGEIAATRVLDPACGSGNFLYVSLKYLLDLEKEVITFAATNGLSAFFPHVGPQQLHGIERNDYAYELAQVVIWIGYLQWLHDNGSSIPDPPILKPVHTIEHMDAVLTVHEDATVSEPTWPEADVIVGNPPFLGGKRLRTGLGDIYVEQLFGLWDKRVPREADLCCYWFEKAREQIATGQAKRAGLLATQAIRAGKNRTVLKRIKQTGDIYYAQADRPWILEGGAVRISMVGFDGGSEARRLLNERKDGTSEQALAGAVPVEGINANLTSHVDVTQACRLKENLGICFQGPVVVGPFDVDNVTAAGWMTEHNPDGRSNRDVLFPFLNGEDITGRSRGYWIVDFGQRSEHEAALYQATFEYVRLHVKPLRDQNNDRQRREYWWRHGRSGGKMRAAIGGLHRYAATPRVAKHRLFKWIPSVTAPDSRLFVFARDDDFFFGVLHSRVHEVWSLATSSRHGVGNDPTYNNTTCFETFPFPEPSDEQREPIATAAAELNGLREGWLNPPGAAEAELKSRTLTNLYNQRPTWLANAHRALDEAVFDAYGWPADLGDQELLARLLELNLLREPA
ncbi:MAG TPA: class I SAM-dependent DNA methyltransferase [Chloroflexi bacterium]|nr:class I SAM-dependent DNA methyltransferase [Chloroflexota bacterium]